MRDPFQCRFARLMLSLQLENNKESAMHVHAITSTWLAMKDREGISGQAVDRAQPIVRLVPVNARLETELRRLRVHPHQEPFVVDFAYWLRRLEQVPPSQRLKIPFAVVAMGDGDEPAGTTVGYIVACPFHEAVAYYCKDASEVGMESLLIDRRYQGRGYGTAALMAMVNYIGKRFPAARRVKFTTNTKNRAAIKLYLRLGFRDTGELHLGGRSGPQHIFTVPMADRPP